MIIINILKAIFGKNKRKVVVPKPVVFTPPVDDIDPLTGQKRKKTVVVVEDTYEKNTMVLFNKLFDDFTNNNIQLSEVKSKYTQKVFDNLGGTYSSLYQMLYKLLYDKKIDIVDVDKNYLETEKNKSTFSSLKNAVVNFSVEDKIKFENDINKAATPILEIITKIANLYNSIDAKKYFDFKNKIKLMYDKQLKYYRDTYGYLKQSKYELIAPNQRDKPATELPNTGGTQTGVGINVGNVGGNTNTTPSEADLNTRPNQIGTIYPQWENKSYLTSEYVIYNGLTYKNAAQIVGNNNNTPDKDTRWQRV